MNQTDDATVNSVISELSFMSIREKSPMSFYIARAETSQTQENVKRIIEYNRIGEVRSIEFIPRTNDKRQNYYSVIVYMNSWNECHHSDMIRNAIRNNEVYKFHYDGRYYWNVSKNQKDTGFAQAIEKLGIKPVEIPEMKYDPRVIHYNAETNLTYGYKQPNKAWEGQEIIEVQQQTIEDLKTQLKCVHYELHKTERTVIKTIQELGEENMNLKIYKLAAEEYKQQYDDLLNAYLRKDFDYIQNRHVPANR